MLRLVRSASLTGFAELARGFGLDPLRLLAEARVPAQCLDDPELKVPVERVAAVLELAADRAQADDFGLRLAETRRLSNLGLVGLVARDQPTLRGALDVMDKYLSVHNGALMLSVEEFDDIVLWRLDVIGVTASRQGVELIVGVMVRTLRSFLGSRWRPQAVQFRHGPPSEGGTALRVLGVRPEYGQALDGVVLDRRMMDAPLSGADPGMPRQVEPYLAQLALDRSLTWLPTVEELVVLLLPTGRCSADQTAAHLGIDRRTLHRHLSMEGTTFRRVLNERRADLAKSLLAQGRGVAAVADLTGFASPTAFSHWHRRAFGYAPREALHSGRTKASRTGESRAS